MHGARLATGIRDLIFIIWRLVTLFFTSWPLYLSVRAGVVREIGYIDSSRPSTFVVIAYLVLYYFGVLHLMRLLPYTIHLNLFIIHLTASCFCLPPQSYISFMR